MDTGTAITITGTTMVTTTAMATIMGTAMGSRIRTT